MKKFALLAASIALLAFAGQALAQSKSSHAMRMPMVTVAMRDPGCHWFQVGTAYKTSLTVKAPAVSLRNYDEASLRVAGPYGSKLLRVGHMMMVGHGVYRITMVGQAPDDNHLKLTVS